MVFQCLKVVVSVWNGGIFFLDVMFRKIDVKKNKKFKVFNFLVFMNSIGLLLEGVLGCDLYFLFDCKFSDGELGNNIDQDFFFFNVGVNEF